MGTREIAHDEETGLPYPEPTTPEPSEEELWDWLFDGACPATDGCEVTALYKCMDELCDGYEGRDGGVYETAAHSCAPWGLDDGFPSELTREGEQLVIPGCERDKAVTKGQLDLFG